IAAVTQLSIPPLIKTTAFNLSEFWSIYFAPGRSRDWILIGLARKSQRVRPPAHSRPICTCESAVGGGQGGRHRESSGPGSRRAGRRAMVKRERDSASRAAFQDRSVWTSRSRIATK